MLLILKKMRGLINEQDMTFITVDDPNRYADYLAHGSGKDASVKDGYADKKPKTLLTGSMKGISPALTFLLERQLEFNPYFRCSASESLQNPFFDDIKVEQLEMSAPYKLKLDIDDVDSFNYTTCKSDKFNKQAYIKMIIKESKEIHKQRLLQLKEIKRG